MAKIIHESKVAKIADLQPFPGNPNRHPQNQIEALAKSIERYGQYYPIVVDEKLQILTGHGKKLALELLGRKEANIVIIKGLTRKQKMKIVAEDNKIQSLSHVDIDAVEALLREIGDTDILGFNFEYLDGIINESLTDNMGVDLSQELTDKPHKTDVSGSSLSKQKQDADDADLASIEDGATKARTIICPHCGKEITL